MERARGREGAGGGGWCVSARRAGKSVREAAEREDLAVRCLVAQQPAAGAALLRRIAEPVGIVSARALWYKDSE